MTLTAPSNIKIIRLNEDQWEEYKKIRLESLQADPQAFKATYAEAVVRPNDFWIGRLKDKNSIFIMAKDFENVVGIIGAVLHKDDIDHQTAEIINVYIDRDYRGLGISNKLLKAMIDEIKLHLEIQKITLWVSELQQETKDFYESFGFNEVGRRKNIVKVGNVYYDAIDMEKGI